MARSMPQSAPSNPSGPKRVDADIPDQIARDRWERPLITPPGGKGRPVPYTRASTLGSAVEDQYGLGQWRMRMVAFGMSRKRDLVLAAAAVPTPDGPDSKRDLGEIAEAAMEAADASAKARIGTALHALTELVDAGAPTPDIGEDQAALDAYAELAGHYTMHAMEVFVVNDELVTAGTFDRLLSPKPGTALVAPDGTMFGPEDRLIGDLKTSSSADYFGIKFAVQLAVYAGGVPYLPKGPAGTRAPWPDGVVPNQHWAVIFHVPSGGTIAEPYWVDLDAGREAAQLAVTVREWRKRRDLVLPAKPPMELDPAEPPAGPEGDGDAADLLAATNGTDVIMTAIDGANSDAALRALYAHFRDRWTDAHTAAVKSRLALL